MSDIDKSAKKKELPNARNSNVFIHNTSYGHNRIQKISHKPLNESFVKVKVLTTEEFIVPSNMFSKKKSTQVSSNNLDFSDLDYMKSKPKNVHYQ